MAPQNKNLLMTGIMTVIGVCGLLGGMYLYGSNKDANLAVVTEGVRVLHEKIIQEREDRISGDLQIRQDLQEIKTLIQTNHQDTLKELRRGR